MASKKKLPMGIPDPGPDWEITKELPEDPDDVTAQGINQVGEAIGSGLSRAAGVVVGTMNAPQKFIQGAMNAPYHNPKEYEESPWYVKPLINLAGGLESAYRSAAVKGDWGEEYDVYYKGKTGRELKEDFGEKGAEYLKLGLALATDPMLGPAMAKDLEKLGVVTLKGLINYVGKKGKVELAGAREVTKFPKQMKKDSEFLGLVEGEAKTSETRKELIDSLKAVRDKKDVTELDKIIEGETAKYIKETETESILANSIKAEESLVDARQGLVQHLNDIKLKAQENITPENFMHVYGWDANTEMPTMGSILSDKFKITETGQPKTELLSHVEGQLLERVGSPYIPEEGVEIINRLQNLKAIMKDKNILESERAASNIEGTKVPLKVREADPELADKMDAFFGRTKEGFEPIPIVGEKSGLEKFKEVLGDSAKAKIAMNALVPLAGIDKDENGEWTYSPSNVAAAGGFMLFRKPGAAMSRMATKAIDTSWWSPAAQKVAGMYQRTIEERISRGQTSIKEMWDSFLKSWVDISKPVKTELMKEDPVFGRAAVMHKELIAGSSAKATHMIEEYNEMIYRGLDHIDSELMNTIIDARRSIVIDSYKGPGKVKHQEGILGSEKQAFLSDLEKTDPAKYADLNARADIYFDAMMDQLTAMKDEGIISLKSFQNLSKYIYSPREYFHHMDDLGNEIRGKKITVGERQIKALDEGSIKLMETDSQLLLAQQVHRTQDIISRNKANLSLYDFAQANPTNGIVEEAKIVGYIKKGPNKGKPIFEDTPAGFEKVSFQINGDHKELIMPKEFAEQWMTSDPIVNSTAAVWLRWLSGTAIVKALSTGYNPIFFLRNMPRDLGLIWFQPEGYSKFMPMAMGQAAKDIFDVTKDVVTRKGRVLDFINEGGSMDFLTYQGRFSGSGEVGEKLNSLGKVLGWTGETSELLTRIALRERHIKNGMSPQEATWMARKYIDFSQGGSYAKGLDNAIPFFNASIQGTRSLVEAAAKDPKLFMIKTIQLATAAGLLYMANQFVNGDTMEEIDDRTQESNFIFTTGLSYTDSKGQIRKYYGTVAKDQGQRLITALVEGSIRYAMTGKPPTKQMMMAVGDLVNLNVPPVLSALAAAFLNADTWTMEEAWRGPDVPAPMEYGPDTNPLAKLAGEVGLSPQRTQVAFGKIVPSSNFVTGMVGWGAKHMLEGMDPDMAQKTSQEIALSIPGVNTLLKQTSPFNKWHDDLQKTKAEEVGRRYQQARDVDRLADKFFMQKDDYSRESLRKYIEAQAPEYQDRLVDRVVRIKQTSGLPDKYWWVSVGGMPTEAKAKSFMDRYKKESPGGQARMIELSNSVSGFKGQDFIDAVAKLNSGGK